MNSTNHLEIINNTASRDYDILAFWKKSIRHFNRHQKLETGWVWASALVSLPWRWVHVSGMKSQPCQECKVNIMVKVTLADPNQKAVQHPHAAACGHSEATPALEQWELPKPSEAAGPSPRTDDSVFPSLRLLQHHWFPKCVPCPRHEIGWQNCKVAAGHWGTVVGSEEAGGKELWECGSPGTRVSPTVSRWCAESLLGILESNRSWPSGTQEEQQVKAWRVTGQPGPQGQHHRRWLIEHTFIPPSSGGWSSKVIRVLTSKQCPRHVDGHLLTRQRGGALRGFFLWIPAGQGDPPLGPHSTLIISHRPHLLSSTLGVRASPCEF